MEASAFLVGKALMETSDCKACHSLTEKSVGPTFTAIADKYAGNDGAVKALSEKVIKGGSGVWGDLMMSPHPQLSTADTEKMIAYILSLSGKPAKGGLPYKGSYSLNKHKPTEKEGTYIFTASYTDRGANGMKPLTATKVLSLSYPIMNGDKFSSKKNVMTFNVTADMMPGIENDMTMTLSLIHISEPTRPY